MLIKKSIKQLLIAIFLFSLIISPMLVSADSSAFKNLKTLGEGGSDAPYAAVTPGENDLAGIIGVVVQSFLGLLGVLFLVYMLYAGFNWMTAQGDEEKVTKAKDSIIRAIIGVTITIAAYAISYWVFDKLLTSSNILK
jgi:hypothetical protein